MPTSIKINRAPVLTLWAAIVAERLGFDRDEALTLGRAVAGYTAQAKGQTLGIYHPKEPEERPSSQVETDFVVVNLMGRALPARRTSGGVRAAEKDKPADPDNVRRYLASKFGEHLGAAERALRELAAAFPPEMLDEKAYGLYERFRPQVPRGKPGWGAAGELDLDRVRALVPKRK
ncbi:MAG TPA: hypothetical protein VLD63_10135 [Anaerolineales bacterium]|nr:hypothetical protein [Anaerolineales bacterium]